MIKDAFPQSIGCCAFLAIALFLVSFHPFELSAQYTKRGLGAADGSLTNSINSRWNYDWNYVKPNDVNSEYVPMFWSGGNLSTKINAIKGYSNTNYVLGFNEPELPTQANMTAENAANQWKTISDGFAGTGIKLVSPAVSDTANGRAWLADFMSLTKANGSTVDEIAFHWYSGTSGNATSAANSFLAKVDLYHTTYNRNVWVTEFGGLDYGNNFTTEESNAWNVRFLETAIPGLESRSYVTRYGWWNHNNDSRLVAKDSYGLWRPTEIGDNYIPTLRSGDSRDMKGANLGLDMQYLRGGSLVNSGDALGNSALGRLYAMSNYDGSVATSQFGGTGDFGFHNWGSVRVEANAKLQKVGTNTVTWRNIDLYHDGEIHLAGGASNAGVLNISGSTTNAQGTGIIRLSTDANLVLGNAADTAGFVLPYDMIYSGGRVTVDGVGIALTGQGTITNQTTFWVNQDFTIDGSFVGNSPGLVKRGAATMTLNGNNQYLGFTNINEGTLAINGSNGGNDVLVNNGGTLAGSGIIAANIVARNGGIVTPGNSPGTLTAAGASFESGSTLVLELESLTSFDRLVLSGLMNVNSGATLNLELLGGYMPSIGNQFDVLDFTSFSGQFSTINAPSLSSGYWNFSQFQSSGIISVSAVPEPSMAGMLLLGLGVAAIRRRRNTSPTR